MNNLDYIFIGLFSVIVLIAGMSFRKRGSDMKSFFAAGGQVPWSISGLSLFMSFFSAGTFVVWGSIAYEYGFVSVTIQWMMCIAGIAVGLFIAPAWRKTGVLTAAEFIRVRLGSRVQRFYTLLILILSLAYMGAFLYPVARIVNVSTNIPINISVIALGLLIIAYTAVGGLWAVIITDVLQFVILTAAVLMVVPLAFDHVNGFDNFVQLSPEKFFNLTNGEYTPVFLFAFAVYNAIFIGGNWAYVQRYTSVRDTRSASKVGYLFAILYAVSPLIWMLPPMVYRVMNTSLSGLEYEGAYLLACKELLPVGMLGLMLGGMIFATASSVNTNLNLCAAVFTNDIFKIAKPKASTKILMRTARISTIVFGVGTILVALMVPYLGGIVEVVLTVGAVTGCSLYGPPIWALFSKRHNGKSILACTLTSLAINLSFRFLTPLFGFSLDRAQEMLVGAISPFILLAGYEVWAWYKNRLDERYESFQNKQANQKIQLEQTPVNADNQNAYGLRVLSNTMVVIGLLITFLGIYVDTNRSVVIGMGITIVVIAAIIRPGFFKLFSKNYYDKGRFDLEA